MKDATEAASYTTYKAWQRAANADGPRGPENVADFNRRQSRIARLKEKYERLLAEERAAARRAEHFREIAAIAETGKCPTCGRPLRRNLSLSGWWQCSQLGAVTHRADATQPSCDWQGFTR